MLFEINSNNNDMENIAFEYFNLPKMDMDMNPKYDNILSPSM